MQAGETAVQTSPSVEATEPGQPALGAISLERPGGLNQRTALIAATVVFLIAMPLFSLRVSSGDYGPHINFTRELLERKGTPPHPLFHLTLIALSGGDLFSASGLVVFICAASLAAASWLSATMFERTGAPPLLSVTVSVLIAFALPLPNWWGGHRYVGLVTPNVWHNPTGVFAIPFALWLFMAGTRLLDRPGMRHAALTGLAGTLSLLAKPNYFLAFVPAFGLALLSELRRMRPAPAVGTLALTFGGPAIVLIAQYLWLTGNTAIIFHPFAVWRGYLREPLLVRVPGAILVGTAFPLAVLLLYLRKVNGDRTLTLAWIALQFGIVMQICFYERARLTDDNFGWGMIYADHVLFVASAAFLFAQRSDWRRWVCLSVLLLHTLSGVQYLANKAIW
jgi:hypothetical protein